MTFSPTPRSWRAPAVAILAAAFCAVGISPAGADPVDTTTPPSSIQEQLARYKEPHVANRWLVEVAGASQLKGGNAKAAKSAQDKVVAAAKAEGIAVEVKASYSSSWNGMSVKVKDSDAARMQSIAGVVGVYPVLEVTRPVEDDTTPNIEYAKTLTGADVANIELGFTGKGVKVGVIDSGIDYNHPDFGGSGVNNEKADFPGPRVKYGYDFVGDAYDSNQSDPAINTPKPDAWPDDCGGHGTHVAGIIGANGDIVGVAPDVTFGAYRVFGCDGSSDSDVIMAAMERSVADGMDVVNMSLGASFMTWSNYPTAKAADAMVDAGVVVVVSQGNEGASGTFSSGAPAVAHNVISVGSVDNSEYMADYLTSTKGTELPYMPATGAPLADPGKSYRIVAANPILGCTVAKAPEPGLALLVSRGGCAFHIKALAAQNAGYAAVVLYNNTTGIINATVEGTPAITIPVVSILQTDGEKLAAEIAAGPTTVQFSQEPKRFDNPTGGYQSDFSSYGLAADLTLMPDVSAPGGSIYSTYPLEKGGFTTMSGTSMAAPHVAGAAALLLEAHPELEPLEVRTALTNTADPFAWGREPETGALEAVHRQGGGMIDIPQAILTSTVIEPSKISLGEGEAGPITTTVTVRNDGDTAVTYTIGVEHGTATKGSSAKPELVVLDADVEFSATSITVPANGTATFTAKIGEDFGIDGAIYGGWITLTSSTEQFVVPFAGLSGDYQALTVLEYAYLTYIDDKGALQIADPFHTFTMVGDDTPLIYFNLAYPASGIYLDVYKANPDGTKGARVHSNFINYATFLDEGRFGAAVALPWDGTYQGNSGKNGKVRRVADGDYILEVRVLKPLGDPSNPDHWETWDSTAFTIAYGEGADTGSGNGPGGGKGKKP